MNMEFKDILKDLRTEKGLKQDELAKELNFSKSIIGKWERGERLPNYEALQILSRYFEISADYLLCLKEY